MTGGISLKLTSYDKTLMDHIMLLGCTTQIPKFGKLCKNVNKNGYNTIICIKPVFLSPHNNILYTIMW